MLKVLRRAIHVLKKYDGPAGHISSAVRFMREHIRPPRAMCCVLCYTLINGKTGIEVGGPSRIFARRGLIPAYELAARIDGANFAASTVWADRLGEEHPYEFAGQELGQQYIREGTDLHGIATESYDFVLSSHAIEHIANPIRALEEWRRVLCTGGTLVLVLPHKEATFDHKRPVTSLEHLEDDFSSGVGEDDLSHLAEVLAFHDRTRDWEAGTDDEFRARCEQNVSLRCLHHHVFDTELAVMLVGRAGFQIIAVEPAHPNHILVVAIKPETPSADNSAFLSDVADWRTHSPFSTDRLVTSNDQSKMS